MIILKICQAEHLMTHSAIYTLPFTLQLCYKPLGIPQRVTKSHDKAVGTGRARGALPLLPSTPILFSKVKVSFFNNHVNTFYLVWKKVKSCFRCFPSKIMIKFTSSVMGKPFLAILQGLKLNFCPSASAPTIMGASYVSNLKFTFYIWPLPNIEELPSPA